MADTRSSEKNFSVDLDIPGSSSGACEGEAVRLKFDDGGEFILTIDKITPSQEIIESDDPNELSAREWLDKNIRNSFEEILNVHRMFVRIKNTLRRKSKDIKALNDANKLIYQKSKNHGSFNVKTNEDGRILADKKWQELLEATMEISDYESVIDDIVVIKKTDKENHRLSRYISRSEVYNDMGYSSIFEEKKAKKEEQRLEAQDYEVKKEMDTDWVKESEEIEKMRKVTIAELAEKILKKLWPLSTVELKKEMRNANKMVETNTLITSLRRQDTKFMRNAANRWLLIANSEDDPPELTFNQQIDLMQGNSVTATMEKLRMGEIIKKRLEDNKRIEEGELSKKDNKRIEEEKPRISKEDQAWIDEQAAEQIAKKNRDEKK